VACYGRQAETAAWTGALGLAHDRDGLGTRVASAHWCARMGAVIAPGTGAVAWPGWLVDGTQGDKVHVRASSRGGPAVGHGNGAGNSPLGRRKGEGGQSGPWCGVHQREDAPTLFGALMRVLQQGEEEGGGEAHKI
jgi:hypothetical protein